MLPLFDAVKQRWDSTDLATSFQGVSTPPMDPTVNRPYATVVPVTETTVLASSKGLYRDELFEVHVVADGYETADQLAELVIARFLQEPLEITSPTTRSLRLEVGTVTYQQDDQ